MPVQDRPPVTLNAAEHRKIDRCWRHTADLAHPSTCLDEGGSTGGTATRAAEGKQEKVEGGAEPPSLSSLSSSCSCRVRFCSSAACLSLESTKLSKTSKLPTGSCRGNKTHNVRYKCHSGIFGDILYSNKLVPVNTMTKVYMKGRPWALLSSMKFSTGFHSTPFRNWIPSPRDKKQNKKTINLLSGFAVKSLFLPTWNNKQNINKEQMSN